MAEGERTEEEPLLILESGEFKEKIRYICCCSHKAEMAFCYTRNSGIPSHKNISEHLLFGKIRIKAFRFLLILVFFYFPTNFFLSSCSTSREVTEIISKMVGDKKPKSKEKKIHSSVKFDLSNLTIFGLLLQPMSVQLFYIFSLVQIIDHFHS